MAVSKLDHLSIRTHDLAASGRFYEAVLGLRVGERPPFDFPGLWLYAGEGEAASAVIHLIGVDPDDQAGLSRYLGERTGQAQTGTGSVDHVAFAADDWPALRARCEALGVAYAQRTVPGLGLHQVFLSDPSGVTIELNYPAAEAGR
jgi:catechol 2,3-dioxygenase-like lactoylglutathione lyase family enzyme